VFESTGHIKKDFGAGCQSNLLLEDGRVILPEQTYKKAIKFCRANITDEKKQNYLWEVFLNSQWNLE
jgi:hypothetical protein